MNYMHVESVPELVFPPDGVGGYEDGVMIYPIEEEIDWHVAHKDGKSVAYGYTIYLKEPPGADLRFD